MEILDELKRLGLVDGLDRVRPSLRTVPAVEVEHKPDADAVQMWREAGPAASSLVQEYLERRGLIILPPTLRFGSYLHLGRYTMPAMVAAVQRPDGKVVAVQRTVLNHRGEKASIAKPKITTGALGRGAVRLAGAAEVMGLAEGIETGLSVQIMAEVPVWVSLGGHRLDRIELPSCVRVVHIFADNDVPGHAAADRTAAVHRHLGRTVVLHFPPEDLNDFNDALLADADDTLRDIKARNEDGKAGRDAA